MLPSIVFNKKGETLKNEITYKVEITYKKNFLLSHTEKDKGQIIIRNLTPPRNQIESQQQHSKLHKIYRMLMNIGNAQIQAPLTSPGIPMMR